MSADEPCLDLQPHADPIRLFVVSDLHAHAIDEAPSSSNVPSWLSASAGSTDASTDAFIGLLKFVDQEGIQADMLICCGDMVDKAVPTAMTYVWNRLHELKTLLNADHLIATAGNHDLDSRHHYNDFDARDHLQGLIPQYPHHRRDLFDKYWSRHFFICDSSALRVVVLNSAAHHGQASEWEHGRVSRGTLDRLGRELVDHRRANVLVTHHHPYNHPNIDPDDYSTLKSAEDLLALLEEKDLGPWLIVHGHKHHPRLSYTGAGSTVFSAGSMSAKLYGELASVARNQAYRLTLHLQEPPAGLDLAGEYESWEFAHAIGWRPARDASGLPARGGFGCHTSRTHLAEAICKQLDSSTGSLKWADLCETIPELRFLIPLHLQKLQQELARQGAVALPSESIAIYEVVRA